MGNAELRAIGVVTGARSDYGLYRPLLNKIQADPGLKLILYVTGMHLSPEFGLTVEMIEADGFEISERVEMLLSSDKPEGIAKSMGLGTLGFAQVFARRPPDILLVLGDRFEMHAAALASLPFKIPVAHIHGGEITQGAMDDALRHSITKLSHLHFVSTREYAERVKQLGEEPWRIVISGALSLDNILSMQPLTFEELVARHNLRLEKPFLLVTYHPVTLEYEQTEWQVEELLAAIGASDLPVLFTMPNADAAGRTIIQMIESFVAKRAPAQMIDNLGTEGYLGAMAHAAAMVGNSSSGIVEAAPFGLPVVNVGTRQYGRVRSSNVIDVGYNRSEISAGIQKALSEVFRAQAIGMASPFGDGQAAERIVETIKSVGLDERLLLKSFIDYQIIGQMEAG